MPAGPWLGDGPEESRDRPGRGFTSGLETACGRVGGSGGGSSGAESGEWRWQWLRLPGGGRGAAPIGPGGRM